MQSACGGARLLAAIFFIACRPANDSRPIDNTHFAPGVIDRVPNKDERTLGNSVGSKTLCTKKSGQWFEGRGYAYCVLPYADAGKLCQNSSDCIGHCIMPLDKKDLSAKPLPSGRGICQIDDSTDDCGRYHFEDGETIIFNCD